LGERQWLAIEEISQGSVLDKGHHDIGIAIGLAKIVDRQDVGVLQLGDQDCLLPKPSYKPWIAGKMAGQNFEGDIAIHAGLKSFINGGHSSFTQWRNDLVGTELFSSQIFHALPFQLSHKII
jgi:hypothetical protein